MTPMPNAANPNAIFGEALARTPAPEPLDVVLGRMAQTQGQALQNRQTAISLAGDQALRDAIRNNSRPVPVGRPPSGFPAEPAPTFDDQGNLIRDAGWHAAAAGASAQAPLPDVNGIVTELNRRGFGDRGLEFLRSVQNIHTNNLSNLKTSLELDQKRNEEIGGRVENLLWLAKPQGPLGPVDQDGLAKAQAAWGPMAAELNQRYGANLPPTFDPDAAASIWNSHVTHDQVLKAQLDALNIPKTKAEIEESTQRGKLVGEQALQAQTSREAIQEFAKNPQSVIDSVDKLPLSKESAASLKAEIPQILAGPGTLEDKVKAVNAARQKAVDDERALQREKELRKIPPAINPETQEYRQELADLRNKERADRSYQFNSTQLDRYAKPVTDLQTRMARLKDSLDQNSPQADTLVGPELLSIMSGGQGSGLRMNEAEIARIVGGRSKWESLKAAAQQWSPDPKAANSITAEQRQQIRSLAKTVQDRLDAKQEVIDSARDDLASTDDPVRHRRIVTGAQRKLLEADQATQETQPGPAAARTAGTPPPPMPGVLSAADVGKVYTSKTGKVLKIRAVNPKDRTQFQADEVR